MTAASRRTEQETAGVIAPPPLIFGAAIAGGLILQALHPWRLLGRPARRIRRIAGTAGVGAGAALIGSALASMQRAGTSPLPHEPSSALVTGGPFRFTRNPIYLAFTLITLGVAALRNSRWVLLLLGPALAVLNRGVIDREERYLEQRFGEDYRRYRQRVRRWL
jgi:protein-S-isoprenylcysteine O-methyltransferase Ste14